MSRAIRPSIRLRRFRDYDEALVGEAPRRGRGVGASGFATGPRAVRGTTGVAWSAKRPLPPPADGMRRYRQRPSRRIRGPI